MNKTLLAGLMALALAGCASKQPEQPFTLTLAHINDTHSHFDPTDARVTLGNQAVFTRLGGHPRLLGYVNALRQQAARDDQPLLFVHGGDAWQGTGYFKLNRGAMNADVLSRMQLDAMALGNHELDLDNGRLSAFIQSVNFPVLAANLDASQDPDLNGLDNLKPYVLYAFDGNKKKRVESVEDAGKRPVVAVMGLVLEDMANIAPNVGMLRFEREVDSAQRTVRALREQGVKYIVAVTHLGLERDQRLAQKVNGIDVIVGGHSHSLLGDFSNLGWGDGGPYARQFNNPDGIGTTCVVQAGQFAQTMGQVNVTFTLDGRVSRCEGGNTLLSDNVFYRDIRRGDNHRLNEAQQQRVAAAIEAEPNIKMVAEDPALRAHIDKVYLPALTKAYGDVVGHVPLLLKHVRLPVEGSGSRVAPLVAASQLYWVNTPEVQAVTGRRADFALVAAGSVRNSLEPGALKEGNVGLELLPFANPVSLVSLTGRQVTGLLLETINASLPSAAHTGRFPYGAGLRYTFNETSRGRGYLNRIEYLDNGQWQRIEPDTRYQVALTGYHASGNDGWNTLFDSQQAFTDRLDLAFVNGKLTGFPVARLSKNVQGAIEVHYINQPLNCKTAGVACNTDARAFIDYVRERRPVLTALPESGITLNRL
ncbi:bifunctional metallophosphatase/5'-nucleotidase [Oceanisphaera arctica]|uniref:Bifunctional metallophosphatase/5'-nucleotidase n=1 Tax=Oceanisphaera arctica TaxID=641510 RepID=A0A2P5TRX2_9GAMM|nr:bifunctional metallophosphatase/5'-nucleotidase [Oceanisphaera arctica]PPL18576.1 bifunctional metallophosphatase/5'-nucleotidase [Oceanisphaera arctica]GHA17512.1 bifunctional metallophosphatase/5'-nucleotidase [Oceanisphaera arctica]